MVHFVRELFPFAVALYLFDAVAWVTARQVVFASMFGDRFRIRRSGLNLLGLLPTGLDLRTCADRPLVTPRVVLLPPSGPVTAGALTDPEHYQLVEFEAATAAVVDHTSVVFGDGLKWKAPSVAAARHFRAFILELASLPNDDREVRIREREETAFDHHAVKQRIDAFSIAVDPLLPLGDALFVLVFLVLPVSAFLVPEGPTLTGGLSALAAALWLALGWMTVRCAGKLSAQGLIRPDMTRLATVLLPPPLAFRGVQALAADLLHDFEPLAVAAHVLPEDRLAPLLRAEIAAVERALTAESTGDWRQAWTRRGANLEQLLEGVGLGREELSPSADRDAGGICPECSASYRPGFDRCSDCDVVLLPLARRSQNPDES
jgi:hypothetical protein